MNPHVLPHLPRRGLIRKPQAGTRPIIRHKCQMSAEIRQLSNKRPAAPFPHVLHQFRRSRPAPPQLASMHPVVRLEIQSPAGLGKPHRLRPLSAGPHIRHHRRAASRPVTPPRLLAVNPVVPEKHQLISPRPRTARLDADPAIHRAIQATHLDRARGRSVTRPKLEP